ncbi:MAG: hypothetical protein M3Y65_09525 [Pseudomonadota bacterium]|nr:hypothetical protein [Pseudomonadota bacterium]
MRAIRRPGFPLLLLAFPSSASARAGDDSFHRNAGFGGHHDDNVPHNTNGHGHGYGCQRVGSWRQCDGGISMAS